MNLLNQLTINNLSSLDSKDLADISSVQGESVDALLDGISAIGNLAFWAATNPDYHEANRDLQKLGYSLVFTAEILKALNLNSACADSVVIARASHE